MMIKEFTERTGVTPTAWEWREIEERYYEFDGGKDDFCKGWMKQVGPDALYAARAQYIEELESEMVEQRKTQEEEVKRLKARITALELDLDKELEWKDTDHAGTHMPEDRYTHLAMAGWEMNDEEARAEVAEEFGFQVERVEIVRTVHTYEVNKHRKLRKKETFERAPVYESTDWNYIRLNCCGWQYEMINGQLHPYET